MEMNQQDDEKPANRGFVREIKESLDARIGAFERRIGIEFAQLKGEFSDFKREVQETTRAATIEQKGQLDAFLVKMETMWRESFSIPQRLDEHRKQLDDHDQRIRSLES